MYIIEDEIHAEWCGEYQAKEEALAELRSRSNIRWDDPPNVCPCKSWRTCGRKYVLLEFDSAGAPWAELSRTPVLAVSAEETRWESGFETGSHNI
jgi:hypothetical protein